MGNILQIDNNGKIFHRMHLTIDSEDSDEYGTPKEGAMRIAIDKVSKRIINEITSTW